ncbi:MAG: hypothetical protein WCF78_04585 [archaeon]
MSDKKPKKESNLTCAGMIKLVLKDYDWLSLEELKDKVNVINLRANKFDLRSDTFTKAINDLLTKKEITIKKVLESDNYFEYNPQKDIRKYYFKLISNFSYKLSPPIEAGELIELLKKEHTNLLFKMNDIQSIREHNVHNLTIEIEAYHKIEYTNKDSSDFLIDIYKCNSPNDAYANFEQLTQFSIISSYTDGTSDFKRYLIHSEDPNKEYYTLKSIKIDFQFKSYIVNTDDLLYINKKNNSNYSFNKTIFLIRNLVIVIYDFRHYMGSHPHISETVRIFDIIQNYITK